MWAQNWAFIFLEEMRMKVLATMLLGATFVVALPLYGQNRDRWEDVPVSSRRCPYDCSTERIPKDLCRDWRDGDTCYLQDMRSSPDNDMRGRYDPSQDPDRYRSDSPYSERDYQDERKPSVGESVGDAIDRAVGR